MDKSWITKPRNTCEYLDGLNGFLDFAFANSAVEGKIICPCPKCRFKKWQVREDARDHLIFKPFPRGYSYWARHGETLRHEPPIEPHPTPQLRKEPICRLDPMQDLVYDAFEVHCKNEVVDEVEGSMPSSNESSARKMDKMEIESQSSISRGDIWTKVHKHVDGSFVNDEARAISEKIVMYQAENSSSQEISRVDSLAMSFGGNEHICGRDRGMRLSVCPSHVFKRCGSSNSSSRPSYTNLQNEVTQLKLQMKELVAQERKLIDSYQRIEETRSLIIQKLEGQLPPDVVAAIQAPGVPSDRGSRVVSPNRDVTDSSN